MIKVAFGLLGVLVGLTVWKRIEQWRDARRKGWASRSMWITPSGSAVGKDWGKRSDGLIGYEYTVPEKWRAWAAVKDLQ